MTDEEVNRQVEQALKAYAAGVEFWLVKYLEADALRRCLTPLLRSVAASARRETLEEAAKTECVLCRARNELHHREGWPLPFHKVDGRARKCAARLIHNLKRG